MKTPFAHCVAQYGTFTSPIAALATTSDGTLLAIAPQEGDIELWDVPTGSCLCRIPVPVTNIHKTWNEGGPLNEVYSLALSDDGLFLAASMLIKGDIHIWTFEGESVGKITGDGGFSRTVSFLPNTSLLAIVLRDTRLQLWNAETKQLHATLPGADQKDASYLSGVGCRYTLACSSDGTQIALEPGTQRSVVSLWEVEQGQMHGEEQRCWRWGKEDFFHVVKFRPSYGQLYHLVKKTIEGYDTTSCKMVTRIRHAGVLPVDFCFSPQGDLLAFADYDGTVYLWSMEKGEVILQFDAREVVDSWYLYYDLSVQKMVWLSQSNLLATAGLKKNDGSGINTVKLWQLTL